MIKTVKEIINMEIQDILRSPEFSIKILKCYSELYLNGASCPTCENSIKKYYLQIKINGIMKAENLENKKCICKKKGLVYPSKLGRHINLQTISDEDALLLIEMKILKQSDFSKLPVIKKDSGKKSTKKGTGKNQTKKDTEKKD